MSYFLSSGIRSPFLHRLLTLLPLLATACGGLSEPHPLYEGATGEQDGDIGAGGSGEGDVVGRSRDYNLNTDAGPPGSPNNRSDGSVTGDAGGGLTPLVGTAQACGMVADALCGRAIVCTPFQLVQTFGSAEVCKKRVRTACVADANASNSGATNGGLIRCSQALNESACSELADGKRPSACRFVGTRSNGQPCGTNMQCQSGYCDGTGNNGSGKGCGQCAAPGGKDATCTTDDECSAPLRCNLEGKCVKPATQGGSCKPGYQPCDANLVCVEGKCLSPVQSGGSCTHPEQCGISSGLVCAPEKIGSESLVCRATPPVAPGNSCGLNGMITMPCIGGSTQCQPVGPDEALVCVAPVPDGDPCSPADGKYCSAPARCIAGVCRLGSPSGC